MPDGPDGPGTPRPARPARPAQGATSAADLLRGRGASQEVLETFGGLALFEQELLAGTVERADAREQFSREAPQAEAQQHCSQKILYRVCFSGGVGDGASSTADAEPACPQSLRCLRIC